MIDPTVWQFTPLALPLAAAAVLSTIAGIVVWRRRHTSHLGLWLWVMLCSHCLWAFAGTLESLSADLPTKILLSQISYLGITLAPITLLHFAHAYVEAGDRPPRFLRLLAYGSAGLILLVVWTNSLHGLLWTDVKSVERGGILFALYERGPFFWFTVVYCYGFMLSSSAQLIRRTLRIGGVFSRQSIIILLATLAPWISSLFYVLRIGPAPELDLTPVGFAATGLLLTLGVLRFHLFDLAPVPADTLFRRIPDPVLVIDRAGRLVRANTAALHRFGLDSASLGEPLDEALRAHPGLVALFAAHPGPRWKITAPIGPVWWAAESGPVSERSGSRLVLLRDITEQKNTEQKLADALAHAEALRAVADTANAAKSTFLTQVSHDLRTPLHAILGISELMLRDPVDERVRADAGTIRDAGGILLRLINDLLDLGRIEAGRITLAHEPFHLEEALMPVVELLSVKSREKNIELEHRVAPGLPVRLCGDVDRLRQILFNLAGNAVKFTSAGGVSIAAGTARGGEALCIRVSDTGPGVPPERLESLFEPFERGDPRIARHVEGTGLGLAIARRLARAMGGDVTVESRPGHGATFTLLLPIIDAHAPPEIPGLRTVPAPPSAVSRPPLAPRPAASIRGKSILLADDQEISRRVSGALLHSCGCLVTSAATGAEALEFAAARTFDLVVLDGQMGEMDGWEVAARLRAGEAGPAMREVPIVALTADLSGETREVWLKAGADAVLGKPSGVDTIVETIARLLAGRPSDTAAMTR